MPKEDRGKYEDGTIPDSAIATYRQARERLIEALTPNRLVVIAMRAYAAQDRKRGEIYGRAAFSLLTDEGKDNETE